MYTVEYYSATKVNETLPFVTAWMDCEDVMLTEISQRKAKAVRSHIYVESKTNNKEPPPPAHHYREQVGGCQGQAVGGGGGVVNWVNGLKDSNFWL